MSEPVFVTEIRDFLDALDQSAEVMADDPNADAWFRLAKKLRDALEEYDLEVKPKIEDAKHGVLFLVGGKDV